MSAHNFRPQYRPDAVELATLEWVFWFNHQRLLGSIGNIPPVEAEQRYYQQLEMSQKQTILL